MKLNKIIGMAVGLAMILSASTVVFAADGDNFVVGTPIDLESGEEVTNLTAGQKILVPVDYTTDTSTVTDFAVRMDYDTSVLDFGIAYSDLTPGEESAIFSYGLDTYLQTDANYEYICAIDPIGTWRGNRFTATGTLGTNEPTEGQVVSAWYSAVAASVDNGPETYFCFTVIDDVTLDQLNFELFEPALGRGESSVNSDVEIDGTADKLNACFGAFNINIDSSALPYWIQALYVKVDGGDAVQVTEYATTDNVNYAFPVRITSNSGNADAVTVEVLADTSTDEAGSQGTQSKVSMGTFEVQLNSPTSYADQTVSAQ